MADFSIKMYIISVPIISRFFGILIYMYWREHEPPHFHAKYGDGEIIMEILTGKVTGHMSPRALALVNDWRQLHLKELSADWELARLQQELKRIDPLE